MNESVLHGLNPASEPLLEGFAQVRMSLLCVERRRQPGNVDTDRVMVDDSIRGANPTVVTIGVRRGISRPVLWRSSAIVEWSRKAGVEHLPAIFGGEPVEHIDPSMRDASVNAEPTAVR
jgi:hypothetical protein